MGDVHIIALQTHRLDHFIQFRPGSFDEGAPKSLLFGTWRLAHEHEGGISGSLSEDNGVGVLTAVRTGLGMVLLQSGKPLCLRTLEIEERIVDRHWCETSSLRTWALVFNWWCLS